MMIPCTHKAISVGITGNLNGTYKFFCMKTRHILKFCTWTEYFTPQKVVNKVDKWGENPKNGIWYTFGIQELQQREILVAH